MNRHFSFYELLGGGKKLDAIIDVANKKYDNVSWKNNFSWDIPQLSLTFSVLYAESNIAPMASVIGYNSNKPTRSVDGFKWYTGAIPKIGHAYEIIDQTMREQESLFASNGDVNVRVMAELLFNYTQKLVSGVHSRLVNMNDQVRSTGKLIISTSNNPDGVTLDIDYNVPESNFLKAGFGRAPKLAWSDPNSDPIQDLIDMVKFADDNDIAYGSFEMGKNKFNEFTQHAKVLDWTRRRLKIADNVTYPISDGDVLTAISGFGSIPHISVYDGKQDAMNDGLHNYVSGFEEANVILRPAGELGKMKNAIPMAKNAPSTADKHITMIEGQRVAILNKWENEDLNVRNRMVIECSAVPTLSNPKNLVILDTTTAAS